MKPNLIILASASFVILASCAGPAGMSASQYEAVSRSAAVSNAPHRFEMSVKEPWRAAVNHGPEEFKVGKDVRCGKERDFVYPASYEAPEVIGNSGNVVPATPTDFKTVKTGLVADLTTRWVGGAVLVEGAVTITEFQGFSRMGGALGQPILDSKGRVITENRIEMPRFSTFKTPVSVAIRPGKSAKFELAAPRKGTMVTFSIQ